MVDQTMHFHIVANAQKHLDQIGVYGGSSCINIINDLRVYSDLHVHMRGTYLLSTFQHNASAILLYFGTQIVIMLTCWTESG